MLSDDTPRRLHPASILFSIIGYIKAFAFPLVLLILGYGSRDEAWRLWGVLLVIPTALGAVAEYFTFTYTYGHDELIVRSGVFFKKERHVPYSRIQNIDANQGILHRLLGLYNVTLESGSGAEAEAALEVLPESALNEMRARVFAGRTERAAAAAAPAEAEPSDETPRAESRPRVLVDLSLRDLALCGLIRGRGLLMLAAIFGVISQYGLEDRIADDPEVQKEQGGRIARFVMSFFEGPASFDLAQILFWLAMFTAVVLALRLASALQTIVTFYGFRMVLDGAELRLTFGLLTHVKATIPLERIQTITIREGALHRWFGVSSVRAATAGGGGPTMAAGGSRYLAPILPRGAVAPLVRVLMPQADLDAVTWQPAHPRAVRRLLTRHAGTALILSAAVLWFARGWTAPIAIALLAFAFVNARLHARHLAHGLSDGIFGFRSGWYMRQTTIAPIRKVQAVGVSESPFDRRHGMAGLAVDTAGATGAPHRLAVPYLHRDEAVALSGVIAAGAVHTTLTW